MGKFEIVYHEKKCADCGQKFEIQDYYKDTLYGKYCSICFNYNVHEYTDGTLEEREDKWTADKRYRDSLQEVTHRGKTRV